MSWQEYVDSRLLGTGKVAKAAIYGLNGGAWASSAGYTPADAEIVKLNKAFTDIGDIAANGIILEGQKYVFLRKPFDHVIYARKDNTGIVAVKTNQAIILGFYDDPSRAGDCNAVVESLGDYLISVGY
ncbi:profilin [Mortierella sp. GBAus27b]|nr:profilin, required for normal timing of actin polymerization in response to thermal stress [Mortierella sp. GBA43]KAI8356916.1 profilin [Mortierella sp. GBAus27b]